MHVDLMQALLAAPEPDDPQDAVVARQVLSFTLELTEKKALNELSTTGHCTDL